MQSEAGPQTDEARLLERGVVQIGNAWNIIRLAQGTPTACSRLKLRRRSRSCFHSSCLEVAHSSPAGCPFCSGCCSFSEVPPTPYPRAAPHVSSCHFCVGLGPASPRSP